MSVKARRLPAAQNPVSVRGVRGVSGSLRDKSKAQSTASVLRPSDRDVSKQDDFQSDTRIILNDWIPP